MIILVQDLPKFVQEQLSTDSCRYTVFKQFPVREIIILHLFSKIACKTFSFDKNFVMRFNNLLNKDKYNQCEGTCFVLCYAEKIKN